MKSIIIILTVFIQMHQFATATNITEDIEGYFISQYGDIIYEFDNETQTLVIDRLTSKKLEEYRYEINNNQILIWNNEFKFNFLILNSNTDTLSLKYEEDDLELTFYKMIPLLQDSEFEIDDKFLKIKTKKSIEAVLAPDKEVIEFKNNEYRKSRTWRIGEENGIQCLYLENEKYYFLGYANDEFKLGKISSEPKILHLIIRDYKKNEFDLNGKWCANYRFENGDIINDIEYKLVITNNKVGTIHRKDLYHPSDILITSIKFIPHYDVIEIKWNYYIWGAFKISELDNKIILEGLELYIEDKHESYTHINELDQSLVKFKKNCD